jgi:hypothetical protein
VALVVRCYVVKRKPKLTKRERKALDPTRKSGPNPSAAAAHHHHGHEHVHCVACGRHLEPDELQTGRAVYVRCDHGSQFASCAGCVERAEEILAEHDRTGKPVQPAAAWH